LASTIPNAGPPEKQRQEWREFTSGVIIGTHSRLGIRVRGLLFGGVVLRPPAAAGL